MFEGLKCHGADITICTVSAATIVVNFNIFKHCVAHLFTSAKAFTVDGFHLQAVKEAFSAGIVVAVALAAHAADQLVFVMRFWYAPEQYWLPRSECTSISLGILRRQSAICKASHTSSAVIRSAMAQPTTSRESHNG